VIERLDEVFGTCGVGWGYIHSPLEELVSEQGQAEIVAESRSNTAVWRMDSGVRPSRGAIGGLFLAPQPGNPGAGQSWRAATL
jgi:hypothetical protein